MGKDAPAEFIIATLATASSFTFFPNLVPLFHRLSRPSQRRAILALALITITTVGVFAGPWWKSYDAMHPKRAGVQYTYNVGRLMSRGVPLTAAHDVSAHGQYRIHGLGTRV